MKEHYYDDSVGVWRRGKTHEIEIHSGWRRVWTGAVLAGDKYLNCVQIREGVVQWDSINGDEEFPYNAADCYGLVIRRGDNAPDTACEHCLVNRRRRGCRFCDGCISKGVHRRAGVKP